MLENMFVGRPPHNYDRLLDYSRPVTGALFFAPTQSFLESRRLILWASGWRTPGRLLSQLGAIIQRWVPPCTTQKSNKSMRHR